MTPLIAEDLLLLLLDDEKGTARSLRVDDLVPATLGLRGEEAREAKRRAKAIAKGEWSAEAVSDAVQATMVAVMTPVIITTASTGGG